MSYLKVGQVKMSGEERNHGAFIPCVDPCIYMHGVLGARVLRFGDLWDSSFILLISWIDPGSILDRSWQKKDQIK